MTKVKKQAKVIKPDYEALFKKLAMELFQENIVSVIDDCREVVVQAGGPSMVLAYDLSYQEKFFLLILALGNFVKFKNPTGLDVISIGTHFVYPNKKTVERFGKEYLKRCGLSLPALKRPAEKFQITDGQTWQLARRKK